MSEKPDATETYLRQLGEIYEHECIQYKKKESCHQLAEFYMIVDKNVSKAKEIYKLACDELGVMTSCFALGNIHLTQKQFKNPEEALRLFNKACDNDQPGACNNAGLMFQTGIEGSSIKQDINKAVNFFEKGCIGGHKNGCFNLSRFFIMGDHGIEKDMKKAFELSKKCCDMSHPYCCANVSRMYKLGDGVEKNLEESEKYKKLAKKHSSYELKIEK